MNTWCHTKINSFSHHLHFSSPAASPGSALCSARAHRPPGPPFAASGQTQRCLLAPAPAQLVMVKMGQLKTKVEPNGPTTKDVKLSTNQTGGWTKKHWRFNQQKWSKKGRQPPTRDDTTNFNGDLRNENGRYEQPIISENQDLHWDFLRCNNQADPCKMVLLSNGSVVSSGATEYCRPSTATILHTIIQPRICWLLLSVKV